jgi:protease-4
MARRGFALIFTFLLAAFVISVVAIVALYMFVGRSPSVPAHAMLTLEVGGDLAELAPIDVATYLRGSRPPTVHSIVESLRKAKVDDRVSGVLLKPTGFTTPFWGKVQEVRDAVLDFRTSGKPLYAYLEHASDRDYYLATAADRVFLMPASSLDLTGVATYQLFLRGTLDKVGVYPDLHHVGDYKTAVNTFTEKGYTSAHKEMDASVNLSLYEQLVEGVAQGRKKTDDEVRRLIDDGPFLPSDALRAGLIDEVGYEDEAKSKLREASGASDDHEIEGHDYARISPDSLGLQRGPRIGVIYASGAIVSGKSGYDPVNGSTVGSETLIDAIKLARKDSSLRALVLRIDSPGGSSLASDAIWHELTRATTTEPNRPLIASMSDLAASGGYYLAMAAESIVAQPSTLTGSIGIYGGKYVTGGLYEKLGATIDSTSRGKRAEINSPARRYSPDEVGKLDEHLRTFYGEFVGKVAASRGKNTAEIERVAQGRVWTGRQALDNGLVDALGGLGRAVMLAKERAKIAPDAEVELVVFPPQRSVYELLSEQLSGSGVEGQAAMGQWMATHLSVAEREALRALRGPFGVFRPGEPLALMPYSYLR